MHHDCLPVSRRSFLAGTVAGASTMALGGLSVASAAGNETSGSGPFGETDLGMPTDPVVVAFAQAFGTSPNGRSQAYFVAEGQPLHTVEFAVVDLRTGEKVFHTRVPRGSRSKAVCYSAAEGSVYIGTRSGELYRHRLGTQDLDYLGTPLDAPHGGTDGDMGDADGIYKLAAGDDGTIYGGTYPGGRVFSYDPEADEVRDYGQMVEGETYIQGLVAKNGEVFAGTQPNARIVRLDPVTGDKEIIPLPEGYENQKNVWNLFREREFLFAWIRASNALGVYDVNKREWVDVIEEFQPQAVSPLDPTTGKHVYFRIKGGPVVRYDLDTLTYEEVRWKPNAGPGAFAWVDMAGVADPRGTVYEGPTLALTESAGAVRTYDLTTRAHQYQSANLDGAPRPVNSIGTGPEGDVYVGLYLDPPGLVHWDPAAEKFEVLRGAGQVEGTGVHGDELVFGRYPYARLYAYDTAQPWDRGTNPDEPATVGDEQDRPHAFASLGDKIAVGTVPFSGRLDGAISLWDPQTGELTVDRGFLGDHSPVSLVAHDGLLYGGTSVWGGFGIDPSEPSGLFFVYDPTTGRVRYAKAPVRGKAVVSGLTLGPDGNIWGLADNWLFRFDTKSQQLTRRKKVVKEGIDFNVDRYGKHRSVAFTKDGRLFVATSYQLLEVDQKSWNGQVLADDGVRYLTADREGDLYFSRGANVVRYRPESVRAAG